MDDQNPVASLDRKPAVIFADDDPEVLLALERSMREEQIDLLMTTDPYKVLGWLMTRKVAVVIADQKMPLMDGTTLLREVQSVSPRTARILLTGVPWVRPVLVAHDEGLMTVLVKPWDDRELRRIIRDRLREREIAGGV